MSDPLKSFNNFSDMINENGNRSSKKKVRPEDEEYENSADESGDDSYIKVKINKTKILGKVNFLEKQNKILKARLEDVTDENLALRENNVKFQVEIFKLRRKLNEMEPGVEQIPLEFDEEKHKVYDEPEKLERPSPSQKRSSKTQKQDIIKRIIGQKNRISEPLPKSSCSEESSSSSEEEEEESTTSKPNVELKTWNDIKISKTKQKELDDIQRGQNGDSKYISKILMYLWDEATLFESSVTGKPPRRPGSNWGVKPLDPVKLRYLRYAFNTRLDRENLNEDDRLLRTKKVNTLINNKINNIRKCRFKKFKTIKTEENSIEHY